MVPAARSEPSALIASAACLASSSSEPCLPPTSSSNTPEAALRSCSARSCCSLYLLASSAPLEALAAYLEANIAVTSLWSGENIVACIDSSESLPPSSSPSLTLPRLPSSPRAFCTAMCFLFLFPK